jgi:hypothetical protein
MTTPTDPKQLAARLRSLEAKATPGPWTGDRIDGTVKYWILGPNEAKVCRDHYGEYETYGFQNKEDEDLVMELRNNLPAILSALDSAPSSAAQREAEPEGGEIRCAQCEHVKSVHHVRTPSDEWSCCQQLNCVCLEFEDPRQPAPVEPAGEAPTLVTATDLGEELQLLREFRRILRDAEFVITADVAEQIDRIDDQLDALRAGRGEK